MQVPHARPPLEKGQFSEVKDGCCFIAGRAGWKPRLGDADEIFRRLYGQLRELMLGGRRHRGGDLVGRGRMDLEPRQYVLCGAVKSWTSGTPWNTLGTLPCCAMGKVLSSRRLGSWNRRRTARWQGARGDRGTEAFAAADARAAGQLAIVDPALQRKCYPHAL